MAVEAVDLLVVIAGNCRVYCRQGRLRDSKSRNATHLAMKPGCPRVKLGAQNEGLSLADGVTPRIVKGRDDFAIYK